MNFSCSAPSLGALPLTGSWKRVRSTGCAEHCAHACARRRRAQTLHRFEPTGCVLPALDDLRLVRGRVMLIGDSTSRYAFDELVAWLRRRGQPLMCRNTSQPKWTLPSGRQLRPEHAAVATVRTKMEHDFAMSRFEASCTWLLEEILLYQPNDPYAFMEELLTHGEVDSDRIILVPGGDPSR